MRGVRPVPAGTAMAGTGQGGAAGPVAAGVLTAALLAGIQLAVPRPMLLADRFVPGLGWAEVPLLAAWAAFLVRRMQDPRAQAAWRRRLWLAFSIAFFAQLAAGLLGVDACLMTGRLHLPVPGLIVAGPIYRGEGWFMPILFGATVLVAGPAWCSHLCYLGAWDGWAAQRRKRPAPAPAWRRAAQAGMLAAVAGTALALRLAGVAPGDAVLAGAILGAGGIGLMAGLSRRLGWMVHCTAWCPVGLLATTLGRLSPFRMRIVTGCTECGACTTACRYDALRPEHVRARRPGPSCTLCGDCVRSCRGRFVEYRFPGLGPTAARTLFLVLVASLHAVFLGVARI